MPPFYQIRLGGSPVPAATDSFAGLEIRSDGETLLLGGELDQAALHGLLERIRVLRLPLLDVRRRRSTPGRTC